LPGASPICAWGNPASDSKHSGLIAIEADEARMRYGEVGPKLGRGVVDLIETPGHAA
jgi:hypothetical protein